MINTIVFTAFLFSPAIMAEDTTTENSYSDSQYTRVKTSKGIRKQLKPNLQDYSASHIAFEAVSNANNSARRGKRNKNLLPALTTSKDTNTRGTRKFTDAD